MFMFEYERQRGEGREREERRVRKEERKRGEGKEGRKKGRGKEREGRDRKRERERGFMYWRWKKIEMNLLCLTVTCFHLTEIQDKTNYSVTILLLYFIQKNPLVIDALLSKPSFRTCTGSTIFTGIFTGTHSATFMSVQFS